MKKVITLIIICLASALLTACGGGGGGTTVSSTTGSGTAADVVTKTVSGVAAAGAPIIGSVYLKDSSVVPNEIGPNPIDSNGNFSFDVTGLKPPFYLYADGTVAGHSYKLFSAATGAGTANINPLSNLAVAAAAGVNNPAAAFNNPVGFPITPANLASAIADIRQLLQPILSAYNANINPITGAAPVGSALDQVFDVVTVSINTSTGGVTVTDKTNNTTIASATTTTIGTASPVTQVPPIQAITDLQAIGNTLSLYAAARNKPNHAWADFDPLAATNFGTHEGFNRTQWINHEVQNTHLHQITSVTNLVILGKDAGTGDYYVDGTVLLNDGGLARIDETGKGMRFTNEGGVWKIVGNGFKLHVPTLDGVTIRFVKVDNSTQIESGLWLEFYDRGNLGLKTATVTGPGLPTNGVTLSAQATTPVQFWIDRAFRSGNIPLDDHFFYVINDATIGTIPDNATYTIKVYDNSNALVETRDVIIPKAPFTRSVAVYPEYFPAGSTPASHSLAAANIGGTLNFTYARPAAMAFANLEAALGYWDNLGNSAFYDNGLLLNTSSGSIISGAPAWTPVGGEFHLWAWDGQGRSTKNVWMFQ